jgi:ABC-type glycerol-3-phosphate transport system substrate-binding protein
MRAYRQCTTCASEIGGGCYLVNNSYIPKGIIGVNKAAKETELAKDFIQWVISEENQSVQVGDGFPMNTAAFHNWLEDNQGHKGEVYDAIAYPKSDGNLRVIEINYPTAEESQVLFDMAKQLTKPATNNIYVMDMIVEEGIPYLAGKKDLDTVCANTMNRVSTYLSE